MGDAGLHCVGGQIESTRNEGDVATVRVDRGKVRVTVGQHTGAQGNRGEGAGDAIPTGDLSEGRVNTAEQIACAS